MRKPKREARFARSGFFICGTVLYTRCMSVQSFLANQYLKFKMKDVPEAQRQQLIGLVEKDPELFKKIGDEIEKRKKGGESELRAGIEVMKKYRGELQKLAMRQ